MTPEQAAAIARRIGVRLERRTVVHSMDCDLPTVIEAWCDHGALINTDDIQDYLATGDRPLRVMEAYQIDVLPEIVADGKGVDFMWRATGLVFKRHYAREKGDTPAAAILACAAVIEGEGHG